MTLALAIWFRSSHLLSNIVRAYINETEMNRDGLLTDSGLFAKLCTYNTESSHIRLNNAYVKMTENESAYSDFTLKFNKFSRKNSLLAKSLWYNERGGRTRHIYLFRSEMKGIKQSVECQSTRTWGGINLWQNGFISSMKAAQQWETFLAARAAT